ncbi:MAG TPA: efflux RND transporter periplasmic adaptor subunit [Pyrinomonadaceae bacterium]|nr:efflux RND transporter periplasmic adaptor subunit [Pyrinomonadaceae bacterium]
MSDRLGNLRALFTVTAIAIAAIAALTDCGKKDTAVALPPPEVLVTEAAARDVPVYREWIGTIDGSENVEIRARVSGYLTSRDYEEGGQVKKGTLLFEIDQRPFEAALAEAKSQLAQAMATAVATRAQAERNQKLFNQKVISVEENTNTTQLSEANAAKVQALQASVEQAQLNLSFCKIVAPVDGIVGNAKAQVGDLVGTGTNTVLANMSTLDPAKVEFPVSETDYLAAIQRAQETLAKPLDQRPESVELILSDNSVFPYKARLLSVNRQVQASTGTILVTALVKNPGSILRPGFFVRAQVTANVLKGAVVVPQRAVFDVQGSYQLGIVGADGKAEIRPVKLGPRIGTDWVITSGLKAGEKVVVEGVQKIKSGAPVNAKPWTPPANKDVAQNSETPPPAH